MKLPKIPTGPYAHVVLSLLVGIAIGVSARVSINALQSTLAITNEKVEALRREVEKQKAPPPVVKAKAAGK